MTQTTRSAQRVATRHAIVEAAIRCLTDEGYTAVTTRRVAEIAGVSQPTVMYHFATREALLEDTVNELALRAADRGWETVDRGDSASTPTVADFLDIMWQACQTPGVGSLAQLLAATSSEPGLIAAVKSLQARIHAMFVDAVQHFFPDIPDDSQLSALADCLLTLAHGLTMSVPTWGQDVVQQRWEAMRPLLAALASPLLEPDLPGREP